MLKKKRNKRVQASTAVEEEEVGTMNGCLCGSLADR